MGNSRSTLLLEEDNLRQIEEETGCECFKHLELIFDLDTHFD